MPAMVGDVLHHAPTPHVQQRRYFDLLYNAATCRSTYKYCNGDGNKITFMYVNISQVRYSLHKDYTLRTALTYDFSYAFTMLLREK